MFKNLLFCFVASFVLFLFGQANAIAQPTNSQLSNRIDFDVSEVFEEVVGKVDKLFYDKNFDSQRWADTVVPYRKRALNAKSQDEFAEVVNALLRTLKTSHTKYFTRMDPKRYQILGVFHQLFDADRTDLFVYDGIGIDTRMVDGRIFVTSVFDGFPAARAGVLFGDEIKSVNGKPFHPTLSFSGYSNKTIAMTVIRGGAERTIKIAVESLDGRTMFEAALESSAKVIKRNGQKVGYVHVWSYAGRKYQDLLRDTILYGKLADCDSLVLDLRDGWGGADYNYLNLFRPGIATVESIPRAGQPRAFSGVWNKPVALITNDGSTSGKELLAFSFKKLSLGKIFGQRTAGAVVAGQCILLSNNDMLYLAVHDVRIDGKRLEGIGVHPDVEVGRPVVNARSGDPQLERAVEFLSQTGDGDGESSH